MSDIEMVRTVHVPMRDWERQQATLAALLAAAETVIREATSSEEIDGMPLVSWLALDQLQRAIAETRESA